MQFNVERRSHAAAAFALAGVSTAFFAAAPKAARAQIVIDNPGLAPLGNWGNPNPVNTAFATFGQVVTAPTGSVRLSDFTFTLRDTTTGGGSIPYRAFVYLWDDANSRATGAALFSSGTVSTPPVVSRPTPGPAVLTINTGVTPVTAGTQYVLFFSTSGVQSGGLGGPPPTAYAFYSSGSNLYSGGKFVLQDSGNTPANFTTSAWQPNNNEDLKFTATFNGPLAAAPEPGSIALVLAGSGPLLLGLAQRRRKIRRSLCN